MESREKKDNRRFLATAVMAVFVILVSGWGGLMQVSQLEGESSPRESAVPQATASGNTVDIEALTKHLLEETEFDTKLERLEDSVAEGMVETEKGSKLELYMGSGTSSDELVVITAPDETAAENNQKAVETHFKEMKKSFEDYIPEQAKKIENAVIIRCGCYVVACVTKDADTAREMIVGAFQK